MAGALPINVRLNAAIVAVTEETPRILTVAGDHVSQHSLDALPFGPLDTIQDRTLERGLRRWVRDQTGLELGYVEQLYTFGDLHRETGEESRILSVAYLALVREGHVSGSGDARWKNFYEFFPWEDRRDTASHPLDTAITGALSLWERATPDGSVRMQRTDRTGINFGLHGSVWDGYRVLERYEQLYEAGLVPEALRDRALLGDYSDGTPQNTVSGAPMVFDHRRIAATALGRLRGKLKYRPVVFELLPDTFTLSQLQGVVEALSGVPLHTQNFRRFVDRGGLVEPTGSVDTRTGGRPAQLFRFRRDVLRERPAPGMGLPAVRLTP
ncbi:NAD regulator [soil metagenome]